MTPVPVHRAEGLWLYRRDACLAAVSFGGAAAMVLLARMLEFSAVKDLAFEPWRTRLGRDLPLPLLLLAVSAVAGRQGYRRAASHRTLVALGAALGMWAAGAALARWGLPRESLGWLDPRAFAFLRVDLLLVCTMATASVLLLTLAARRPRSRWAAVGAVHVLALGVLFIAAVDIVALVGTGAHGGYFALRSLLADPGPLMPVLMSEFSIGLAVVAAAPFLLFALPLLWWARSRAEPTVPAATLLGVCAPLAALLAVLPADPGALYPESGIARLVTLTRMDLASGTADLSPESHRNPFDLRETRLVATRQTDRRNVVVLVLESVRRDATTPYAPDLPTTPFLDSLAREGLLVEDLFATTPSTNRALVSIFGGIPPSLSSTIVEAEPGRIPSPGLPALLRPLGYRSVFFTPATFSFERKDEILANLGFDEAYGDGAYRTAGFQEKAYFGFEDRVVLERALAWAAARGREGTPFLMGLLTLSSHHPYDAPDRADRLNLAPEHPDLDAYYDAVRYTDGFIRDLVTGFEERGLLDRTVFLIVGDHGEAFGEHGERAHDTVIWDEALRIPGVLYAPGFVPRGTRVTGPHQLIDVLPTVAELIGARWEGPRPPGRSLTANAPSSRVLFHSTKDGRLAVALRRNGRKYIYRHGRRPTEVYNLAEDPGERRDAAARVDSAEIRRAERELVRWLRRVRHLYTLS